MLRPYHIPPCPYVCHVGIGNGVAIGNHVGIGSAVGIGNGVVIDAGNDVM